MITNINKLLTKTQLLMVIQIATLSAALILTANSLFSFYDYIKERKAFSLSAGITNLFASLLFWALFELLTKN